MFAFVRHDLISGLGLYWEFWQMILVWLMACCLSEALCFGKLSPLAVLMSFVPLCSERLESCRDKIFSVICLIYGGPLGVTMCVVCIAAIAAARLILYYHFPPDLASCFFTYKPQMPVSVEPRTTEQATSLAVVTSAKLQLLRVLEENTRPYKVILALVEDLPHGVLGVIVCVWRGGSGFVYFTVVLCMAKVVLLPVCRIFVLQQRGEWSESYKAEVFILSVALGLTTRCCGTEGRATLALRLRRLQRLNDLGKSKEMLTESESVLAAFRKQADPQNLSTLEACYLRCRALRTGSGARADREEGLVLAQECWRAREARLGEAHCDTLVALREYATSLDELGRTEEAADFLWHGLELGRTALGERHPVNLKSLGNYASFLRRLGRIEEASEITRQSLELRRAVLGEGHPETLNAMGNYSQSLHALGRIQEAAELRLQCFELKRAALGPCHPSTLAAMQQYGDSLSALGRMEEAASLRNEYLLLTSG